MSMSRKDYVAIAKSISDGQFINCATQAEVEMNTATRMKLADQIASYAAGQSAAFDRHRFLKACGLAVAAG